MPAPQNAIAQTRAWVETVIIGLNFCPFAAPSVAKQALHYRQAEATDLEQALHELVEECQYLDQHSEVETSLVIFPELFRDFDEFIDLIAMAEELLAMQGYQGVYQLAHFHPDYCFEGVEPDDPANYTNRSPFPMLHIIRETSLEQALSSFPNPEQIPERNVALARERGAAAMAALLAACRKEAGEDG